MEWKEPQKLKPGSLAKTQAPVVFADGRESAPDADDMAEEDGLFCQSFAEAKPDPEKAKETRSCADAQNVIEARNDQS